MPNELLRSDRQGEAQGVKKRAQLRGDAVDRAGDDAEDGRDETHGTTSLSAGAESETFLFVAATATYSSTRELASDC